MTVIELTASKAKLKKVGRPSKYTKPLGQRICVLIAEGYSERQIEKMPGMPTRETLRKWKEDFPEFLGLSVRARELSAEMFDDKRREAAEWLMNEAEERSRSGDSFPKGVVDAVKAVMQEHARSAALRDDSRFGDRKTVKVDATKEGAGMADVYAKMLDAMRRGDNDA